MREQKMCVLAAVLVALTVIPVLAADDEPEDVSSTITAAVQPVSITVSGAVFIDKNGNNVMDPGENGIEGIQITDGVSIILTGKDGTYKIVADYIKSPFVYATQPNGYRFAGKFYTYITTVTAVMTSNFGIVPVEGSTSPDHTFVHITDIHIGRGGLGTVYDNAVKEINGLTPKPAFITATGDLVNAGKDTKSYEKYADIISKFNLPIYNVLGNHDIPVKNYEMFLGPAYYSFDYGTRHFVVVNCKEENRYTPWLMQDLELNKDKEIVVFQHYHPEKKLLDLLSKYNTRALLFGHWHSTRTIMYGKIMIIATQSWLFGGIDFSPKGFRVITFKNGKLSAEIKYSGITRHAVIASPAQEVRAGEDIDIRVNLYDTVSGIAAVEAKIDNGKSLVLTPQGGWLWKTQVPVPGKKLSTGKHIVSIKVHGVDGSTLGMSSEFMITKTPVVTSPKLVSTVYAGNNTAFSSPAIYKNTTIVGTQDDRTVDTSAIVAVDNTAGKVVWKYGTDSAVIGSVVINNGIAYGISVTGTLYAVNAEDGVLRWKYTLNAPEQRWVYNAPEVKDGVVYFGVPSQFVALDANTGYQVWASTGLGSTDWISTRMAPYSDGKNVYIAFNWHGVLNAVDKTTGSTVWRYKFGGRYTSAKVAENGNLIYFTADKKLYAIDKSTGGVVWAYTVKSLWNASEPVVTSDGTGLIIGTSDGQVVRLNTAAGTKVWEYQTGKEIGCSLPYRSAGVSAVMSSPLIVNNMVYVGSNDGNVYALDAGTGEKKWGYTLGVPVVSKPVVEGDKVVIAATDGNIYTLEQPK
ncbi:MAG: PQQ-binding-like beta-propeller repeat protein [Elusimicrobiota bacterium]